MSNIFTFVESEVLIGVIGDNYIYCWSAFDFVDTINYVDIGVFSSVCMLLSVMKWAVSVVIDGLLILMGTTLLCLGGILRVDLTVPMVAFWVVVCVKDKNLPFLCI